ncbi:MAG: hypothetical protein EOM80_11440, partial [Erysipelotrichia bacterium]|nr:hypothetical protein [Erysipelotrichia bacterium]
MSAAHFVCLRQSCLYYDIANIANSITSVNAKICQNLVNLGIPEFIPGNIIYKNYYNIGIAVDTENGLVVPVVRDVDKKSIMELAIELNDISEKARERKLTLDDMKDGTFTITSYGSIGGYFAVPVINYPQVAIFGIGKLTQKPIVQN